MISENKDISKLPEVLQKYFWDVDFNELTTEKYPRFIAERILNYGDLSGVRWLLSWADSSFLRTIVDSSRNLNSKTRNYWRIVLT